ncbi:MULTISPECIES: bifunctional 4-hydroxy-2-oxoglutarate aldolase/2-dehydro-3-deoxy-phosphogluconate aldolase [Thermus]|uniref:2-dehydro-3-deoxy-phosphogluconate aldolase n=1 Tax=Thermus brockianus TaxID=56956 RepID=A0A1J0LS34_THEBO|nr:bifunctional 4-hydroxy-2-oxoglutarate aldolase/2-dehydro-3-deoxy-phosphogluconate aldolase [Thermus brockianus]APD08277.1 4-hydroxy-2-oxoglutarate aldolase/2-deydro-3-deoxyphosphogluconate aldolase [Thermus brockianus]BDG16386.1 4-hydroxy-2-oxoglutarate aldolase [Thermus brockianus]
MEVLDALAKARLLPLLTVRGGEDLRALAQVLREEGVGLLEITLRTPQGLEALRVLGDSGLLLGAGTVRSLEEAKAAMAAGARFLVSPGLKEAVACLAQEEGVPYFPGVLTPTEVERALELGLSVLKFFPAEPFQGAQVLRAYAEVFPEVRFLPTGGIKEEQLPLYAPLPNLLAVGGSWLLAGDAASIRGRIRRAKALLRLPAQG